MTLSLDEAEFAQAERVNRTIAELEKAGVRKGSLEVIRASLERNGGPGDPAGYTSNPEEYDPVLAAYKPDARSDELALLKKRLASDNPPTLEVHFPALDGVPESIAFSVAESRRYLEGDLATQETMRTRAVRERRLRTAIAAASALREKGGRRAAIEVGGEFQITPDEEICLREFSGLVAGTKYVREDGGPRVARESIMLREGWHTKAARALREGSRDLDPVKLREDWGFSDGDEAETNSRVIGGWVGRGYRAEYAGAGRLNLGIGPTQQQMMISEVWDEQFKAKLAFATDPFCKQGIKISSNFVYGRGISVAATSKVVQAVLDEYDKRHTQSLKKRHLRSTLLMGEVFLWKQPLPGGRVKHVKLPAQTIWGVIVMAEDITVPLYYVQRYYTNSQMIETPDNAARYIDRIIPANEVIHWKINAEEDEVRGRSQTYAALPWHQQYRDIWRAEVEKAYAVAAYAYVATVKGTDAQVRTFVANNVPRGRVRPGHTRVFNDKVLKFEVVKSGTTAPAGTGSVTEGILNALSANYGFAKEYFGVDGNRTRGGAVTSAGPAEKSFEDLQDDYGEILTAEYQDAVDAAVAYGLIPPVDENGEPIDLSFQVNFPDIIKADSQPKVLLLTVARAQGVLSHRTYSSQMANALDLGATYDYDAEQAAIKEEAANGITLPAMPPKFDSIDPTGQAPPGGADPNPDPASANGQQQIRQDDLNSGAVESYLRARGAIAVYP